MKHKLPLFISCEHAVNTVPPEYKNLFEAELEILNTHRAIDFGCFDIARTLSHALQVPMIHANVTRLLIDCNRTVSHPSCFSSFTASLPEDVRQSIIQHYYQPYRSAVMQGIEQTIMQHGFVVHLSIHSFTPVFNGETRQADMGFLYDPKRTSEVQFVGNLIHNMKQQAPHLRIRRNYPYLGINDGFTSALRKKWPDSKYSGIEIESNQGILEQFGYISQYLINSLKLSFPNSKSK